MKYNNAVTGYNQTNIGLKLLLSYMDTLYKLIVIIRLI